MTYTTKIVKISPEDLVFTNVSAGHYLIIRDNSVVGDVKRRFKYPSETKWARAEYVLTWYEDNAHEYYDTIADIAKVHKFVNYSGYNHILRNRNYY